MPDPGSGENSLADGSNLAAVAIRSSFVRRFHRRIILTAGVYGWRPERSKGLDSSSSFRLKEARPQNEPEEVGLDNVNDGVMSLLQWQGQFHT